MAAAMAAALLLGLLLLALRPKARASTRNALILLGLCALAELADSSIASFAGSRPAAIVADVASVLVGLVLIRLATIFVFRVLLPAVRLPTLRITEDLVTAGLYVSWGFAWLLLARVDLGRDHRGARLRDAGHARQRAGRPLPAARPVAARGRLGARRAGERPDRRDRMAPHRGADARPRDGDRAQRLAGQEPLHRDRRARRPDAALAPLGARERGPLVLAGRGLPRAPGSRAQCGDSSRAHGTRAGCGVARAHAALRGLRGPLLAGKPRERRSHGQPRAPARGRRARPQRHAHRRAVHRAGQSRRRRGAP